MLVLIILCLLCGTLAILGNPGNPDDAQPATGERSHFVFFAPFRGYRGPNTFHPGQDLVFVSGTYLWYNLGEGLDQEIGSRCSGFRSERAVMLHVLPPVEFRLTNHARFEMECRGISEAETAQVLSAPEQADLVRPGRVVTAYRR